MAEPSSPLDSPRTVALVRRLIDDARPVRRLWRPGARLAVWLAAVAVVGAVVGLTGLRPDLGARLRDPDFVVELAAFAIATILFAARAWDAAVPGRRADRRTPAAAIALVVAASVLWLAHPVRADVALGAFVERSLGCATRTAVLAAIPWVLLLVGIGRGAPLMPLRAGLLAGGAAFSAAALLVRLVCPSDDPLHLVVGHALPLALGVAASTAVGLVAFRRRRRAP